MAAKKKTKKKQTKKKQTRKKQTKTRQPAARKATPARKAAKKKVSKGKASGKKKPVKKAVTRVRKSRSADFSVQNPASPSGSQSGDLQGLSRAERADSESVDELLEEGNAFEADAVLGVQEAGDEEEREVRTHEVPEDDVPGEYLDKD
jgi:hypothetical protein